MTYLKATWVCVRAGARARARTNCLVVSDFAWPHGPVRVLCPWNSPGKNTGVACHALLQRIFPTQGSNPGHPRCRWILYCLSHHGSPLLYSQWLPNLEKEMATHSRIFAWRIPWTEEPGRLKSMGLQESDMTWWLNHHPNLTTYQHHMKILLKLKISESLEFLNQ